ncbi:HNH endonuclease [Rhodococcus erythropolis]|uniref:HNH endonuclease n=1 Tax=Rhodococcus erythropolis TaxID=1833 RepID=UPI00294934DE|nr:HNH endonuclease [Rhodococcus erythropolis]MDV6277999.1 HNH endonuclease [Rhodococcus erythropolis]
MIKFNPNAYTQAAERVASGIWKIDPDKGHVIGLQGHPLYRLSPDGYVHLKFRDTSDWRNETHVFAHRLIWEHVHGPIPPDMTINHKNGIKDDNRLVNLELTTVGENIRHSITTGLRVGRKGEDAANCRLNESQVREIYSRSRTERVADLARDFGVAYWTVSSIKHGHSWKHATGHVRAA